MPFSEVRAPGMSVGGDPCSDDAGALAPPSLDMWQLDTDVPTPPIAVGWPRLRATGGLSGEDEVPRWTSTSTGSTGWDSEADEEALDQDRRGFLTLPEVGPEGGSEASLVSGPEAEDDRELLRAFAADIAEIFAPRGVEGLSPASWREAGAAAPAATPELARAAFRRALRGDRPAMVGAAGQAMRRRARVAQ